MINASPVEAPVTELDLAAYAEDVLTPERKKVVERFLQQHPDIECLALRDTRAESGDGRRDVSPATPATREAPKPAQRRWPSPSWSLMLCGLAALLVSASWVGVRNAQASVAHTLDSIENTISSGNFESGSRQAVEVKFVLKELGDSLLLSGRERVRRDTLLGRVYLNEATSELARLNITRLSTSPADTQTVRLCENAISVLREPAKSSADARYQLVRAYRARGKAYYLHGTFWRESVPESAGACQRQATKNLLTGLELLDNDQSSEAETLRVQLGWLLAKSMHKGSLAQARSEGTRDVLRRRLARLFPDSAQLSKDDSQANTDIIAGLMKFQPTNSDGVIAKLNTYNTLGLRLGLDADSIPIFQEGIELAESQMDMDAPGFRLVYGQLLGNLADSLAKCGPAEQELEWRERSIRVFREATLRARDNELYFELGWVLSRQLIATYRQGADTPAERRRLSELLGALINTSGDFESFEGYQIGMHEEEFLWAIRAELQDDSSLYQGATKFLDIIKTYGRISAQLRQLALDFRDHGLLREDPDFREALRLVEQFEAEAADAP